VRYEGRIHETMVPSLSRLEASGHRIVPTRLAIDHLGYVGDQSAKHARNLPLLEQQVAADPARPFLWYHLGSVRLALGDDAGAEEAWRSGVEASRRRPRANPLDVLCYSGLVVQLLAGVQQDASPDGGTLATARALADEMRCRLSPSHQLEWIDASVALFEGRWTEAMPRFEQLAAVDPDSVLDPCLAFERDIFRAGAFHGIGVCRFELGQPAEAARWFAAAERCRPDVAAYRTKRVVAEHRAGEMRSSDGAR
jgi:tetratricopeptide (TPR) repeat protein